MWHVVIGGLVGVLDGRENARAGAFVDGEGVAHDVSQGHPPEYTTEEYTPDV